MAQVPKNDIEAGGYEDNGDVVFRNLDFTEKTIRHGFIKKVYGILMCQLGVTVAFMSVFMFVRPVKQLMVEGQGFVIVIVAFIVAFITLIIMHCSTDARRKAPGNFIFLGVFTISFGFMMGSVASFSGKDEIFMAMGICTLITLALTIFAMQTKYDFTLCHTGLFVLLLIVFGISISSFFLPQTRIGQLITAGFGAFVFSLLLIYDTQLIIGGDHKLSISPEEYVFAALTLYLDIINLFLRILRIIRIA